MARSTLPSHASSRDKLINQECETDYRNPKDLLTCECGLKTYLQGLVTKYEFNLATALGMRNSRGNYL